MLKKIFVFGLLAFVLNVQAMRSCSDLCRDEQYNQWKNSGYFIGWRTCLLLCSLGLKKFPSLNTTPVTEKKSDTNPVDYSYYFNRDAAEKEWYRRHPCPLGSTIDDCRRPINGDYMRGLTLEDRHHKKSDDND